EKEVFVESTQALGASPFRLVALHVLPNIASPIIVRSSIGMGFTILTAAALGFLGLGPPPPTPEWGRTIAESREFLPDAWWYATARSSGSSARAAAARRRWRARSSASCRRRRGPGAARSSSRAGICCASRASG